MCTQLLGDADIHIEITAVWIEGVVYRGESGVFEYRISHADNDGRYKGVSALKRKEAN